MSHNSNKRLAASCCGMDLCWLCAWANFLAVSTTQITFPMGRACAAFFMAVFMSYFFRARRYRRIWSVLGHALGLGLMIWAAVSEDIGQNLPFTFLQWYQMTLIAAMVGLFWYKGTKLSSRQMSYHTICNYFDLGISLLFSLLIIKMLIQIKGGIIIQESFTLYLMGGYFFFGLIALFFSQDTTIREKQYIKGFRVYGVLISVIIALLFCGIAMVFILLPFMISFAESGYDVLKQAAGPLSPYLIAVLRFLFAPRKNSADIGIIQQNPDITGPHIPQTLGYTNWADHLFFSAFMAILFLICVFMTGYIAYKIFKFLMSKQSLQPRDKEEAMFFLLLIRWLVLLFNSFKTSIQDLFGKVEDAKKGFIKLISWGRKSGMIKLHIETPSEYAQRLQHQFAPLENEIKTILHAFHLETYGEMPLDKTDISQMAKALKTMHSPLFWPLRIKTLWRML